MANPYSRNLFSPATKMSVLLLPFLSVHFSAPSSAEIISLLQSYFITSILDLLQSYSIHSSAAMDSISAAVDIIHGKAAKESAHSAVMDSVGSKETMQSLHSTAAMDSTHINSVMDSTPISATMDTTPGDRATHEHLITHEELVIHKELATPEGSTILEEQTDQEELVNDSKLSHEGYHSDEAFNKRRTEMLAFVIRDLQAQIRAAGIDDSDSDSDSNSESDSDSDEAPVTPKNKPRSHFRNMSFTAVVEASPVDSVMASPTKSSSQVSLRDLAKVRVARSQAFKVVKKYRSARQVDMSKKSDGGCRAAEQVDRVVEDEPMRLKREMRFVCEQIRKSMKIANS
jgi:hypothetical protein